MKESVISSEINVRAIEAGRHLTAGRLFLIATMFSM